MHVRGQKLHQLKRRLSEYCEAEDDPLLLECFEVYSADIGVILVY